MARDRHNGALDLFTSALEDFRSSLPEEDRNTLREFKDPESMIRAIEEQVGRAPQGRRMLSCCKMIERFAKKWEPFFQIINIFVSTHPEYAGLAWGAIRLVFQVQQHILPSQSQW